MPKAMIRAAAVAALFALGAPVQAATDVSGPYLAGVQADYRDDYAEAAAYYGRALAADPGNAGLLQRAALTSAALGDFAAARGYADRIAESEPGNQLSVLIRVADDLADGNFEAAGALIEAQSEALPPLLRALLQGWVEVGNGNFTAASEIFDGMGGNLALESYGQYHKALALALAGDFVSAERLLAGEAEGEPLHVDAGALIAHAEILAQLGRQTEAVGLLDEALQSGVPDPSLTSLRARIDAGEPLPFSYVSDARRGAARAFLTLAAALDGQETLRVALIHGRMAAHIGPDLVDARLVVAGILEEQRRFGLATKVLEDVPEDSPWVVTAEIRRASYLRADGNANDAIAVLEDLAARRPEVVEVWTALGDAHRQEEQYAAAARVYGTAVDLLGEPKPAHWVIYYMRGIARERIDDWEGAEADFRQALALQPEQPEVLNYLGYSLVEKGVKLEEALDMIRRAVEGRPDDGYITDSLGWVLYRLERYDEAVEPMLRAVELTPDDPIINDHLGDVLWRVGRRREARFQWRRALSFGPADDLDMDFLRRKLEVGLDRAQAGEGGAAIAEPPIETGTDG